MNKKKINILAFGAHPDDVEACAGGLLAKAKSEGLTTGIIDFTRGESSNFGTMKERDIEAKNAAKILKLDIRDNLNIPDSNFDMSTKNIEKVVEVIRMYKPDVLIAPYFKDLHPGHALAGQIVERAAFFAKIDKFNSKSKYRSHQISMLIFFMLHTEFQPSFILDTTDFQDIKEKSTDQHKSQFFKKINNGYSKDYHNPDFMNFFKNRSKVYGYKIGTQYGEPFLINGFIGIKSIKDIFTGDFRSLTSWNK